MPQPRFGFYPCGVFERNCSRESPILPNLPENPTSMCVEIKHIVFIPFLAFTFESFIDHV